ncbi:MAG TPA: hypothetical protein VH333_19580 [Pseudonocardiaceae bacterium]|nr:hypothetical protein [Pseudonocardiaceae bacterium]
MPADDHTMNSAETSALDSPLSANSSAYSEKNGIVCPSSAQPTDRRASRRAAGGSAGQRNRRMPRSVVGCPRRCP